MIGKQCIYFSIKLFKRDMKVAIPTTYCDPKKKMSGFWNSIFSWIFLRFFWYFGWENIRIISFFFHMSNRSSDLSFNVYHQKTDFSRFWKWWKSDIWHENSWYFQRFWSEFFEFQDSGSKYLKLSFPLIRTWFGLILSDLEQFENCGYFRKFHVFFNDFCL